MIISMDKRNINKSFYSNKIKTKKSQKQSENHKIILYFNTNP